MRGRPDVRTQLGAGPAEDTPLRRARGTSGWAQGGGAVGMLSKEPVTKSEC